MTSDTQTVVDDLDPTTEETNGRRNLLRKVALGSAAAAVATVALDRTASAADGDNVVLGDDTLASETPTVINYTPGTPSATGPSALSVGGYVPPTTSPFAAAVGGYGDETITNGLHGSTTAPAGYGVVAANLSPDPAADDADAPGALAIACLNGPQVRFVVDTSEETTAVSGPTTGLHVPGELYVDKDYTLWYTVPGAATTDPPRFIKLAGTGTAGSFHALPVPKRCFDSRLPAPGAKIAEGASVNIDLTKDSAGAASGLPAGAVLAVVNLTINQTEGGGFVSLFAKGAVPATVDTSNINWFQDNTSIANATNVPLDATGSIAAFVGSNPSDTVTARTHVIVDLVGYYL